MEELQTTNVRKLGGDNPANIYRAAWRCDIEEPKMIGKEELYFRYKECKEYTKSLMASSSWMRKQFMSAKLAEAVEQNKTEEAQRIKEVLKTEAHRKEWMGIHRVTDSERAGAITHVDVKQEDGTTTRMDTKRSCERAIGDELEPRFERASSAPVCQGALFRLLGYEITTDVAIDILENRWEAPEGTDEPTLTLFKEMSHIWQLMKDGEVDIVITEEDF